MCYETCTSVSLSELSLLDDSGLRDDKDADVEDADEDAECDDDVISTRLQMRGLTRFGDDDVISDEVDDVMRDDVDDVMSDAGDVIIDGEEDGAFGSKWLTMRWPKVGTWGGWGDS
jgi:hypothetical protein